MNELEKWFSILMIILLTAGGIYHIECLIKGTNLFTID